MVREAGSSVPVNVELTREDFPVRTYGGYRFPAGEYETLQVTLGSGEGHNWWCLIFPSLCFQDSLHPVLSEDESLASFGLKQSSRTILHI